MDSHVALTRDDYTEVLAFVLKLRYLWRGNLGDFRGGVQRDIGKYIHDHTGGKLAERAFVKFAEESFRKRIKMDFTRFRDRNDYSKPDIIGAWDGDHWRDPRVKIEIKDTKPSSRWILIPSNLVSSMVCDYFVVVCVDLALDQLLRFFKSALPFQHEHELLEAIPDFGEIGADIKGAIPRTELTRIGLTFDEGDSLPETDIFAEAKRWPSSFRELPQDRVELDFGGPVGKQLFTIEGKCRVVSGSYGRGSPKVIITSENGVVLSNGVMGSYSLPRGIFRADVGGSLSPLREPNIGIPLNAVPALSEGEWQKLIESI